MTLSADSTTTGDVIECACGKPGWYEHHEHGLQCRQLDSSERRPVPARPMPGDAVRLDGEYSTETRGTIAIVDGAYYDPADPEILICFRASAFRAPLRRGGVDFGSLVELAVSGGKLVGPDMVSCSGGPLPFVNVGELTYVGMHRALFWRWKDGIAGGGRGESYYLDVPLWSWKGRPRS